MKDLKIIDADDGYIVVETTEIASFISREDAQTFVIAAGGKKDEHDNPYDAAIGRIVAGENLVDVATDMGIPWRSLRGKYGIHCKMNGRAN